MKRYRPLFLAILLSVTSIFGAFNAAVYAQDSSGSGLIISPTRTDLEIPAGGTDIVPITLRNVSGSDIVAEAIINDFTADNETGSPKILPISDEVLPTSIQNFITNLEDIELGVDEKKDFELEINIPDGTPAGAYYGIVRYTAIPKDRSLTDDERQIALSASLGTLVLITVPGDITEQFSVEGLEVSQAGKVGSLFTTSPDEVAVKVRNLGNGFTQPFGTVSVYRGSETGQEVFSYELNNTNPRSNVLPDSSRTYRDAIEGVSSPGRYTVVANVSFGNGGEVTTQTVSFWYIPVWLLAVAGVLVLLLVVGGYVVYRMKFRSKRR